MTAPEFTTRELSKRTWPDFERLFRKPGEWGACWCVYYERTRPPPSSGMTVRQRADRNRKEKKGRVEAGRSHGILVYSGREPVGWCQYGPKEDIPRIDATRRYRALRLEDGGERIWRISCFCVDRKYRGKGVAAAGLEAALDSIRRKGGGVVEAYPVTRGGALATWFGTIAMFERHGFKVVAPFGRSNVLVRNRI